MSEKRMVVEVEVPPVDENGCCNNTPGTRCPVLRWHPVGKFYSCKVSRESGEYFVNFIGDKQCKPGPTCPASPEYQGCADPDSRLLANAKEMLDALYLWAWKEKQSVVSD
jgi:hypothetical protein